MSIRDGGCPAIRSFVIDADEYYTATTVEGALIEIMEKFGTVTGGLDWQASILDKDLTAPPGGESGGERYIVAAVGAGDWAGHDNAIAEYDGNESAWDFMTPDEGTTVYVEDENMFYMWNGAAWTSMGAFIHHGSLVGLTDDDHTQYRAFGTITGITNDVVADAPGDTLTLASANAILTIVGTAITDTITLTVNQTQIDHDLLTNFVADKHVAHTGVTLTAGDGLTGGGDISANRTFAVGAGTGISVGIDSVSLNHLGIQLLVDPGADRIMFWDDSETAMKWLVANTGLAIDGTNLNCSITQYTDALAKAACISDAVYGIGWNGVTDIAPSKNAVYDYVSTLALDSIVLKKDGTVALTANWDVGAFIVTALRFISDVAIGTAPYSCTSTTVNTNLNADLWDGYQFSDYLDQGVKTTSSPIFVQITIDNAGAGANPIISSNDAGQLLDITGSLTVSGDIIVTGGTITFNNQGAGGDPIFDANNAAQLLNLTGALTVSSDLTAANIVTVGSVDGVDISAFKTAYDAHVHDGQTLQLDGVNSNGGAFSFTTTGAVTFNQAVTIQGLATVDGLVPEEDVLDDLGTALLTWRDVYLVSIKDAAGNTIFTTTTSASYFTGDVGFGRAIGAIGYAIVELYGTASNANGPHMQFVVSTDNYPTMQIVNWSHDNVNVGFDAYYDGAWRSSDVGSNFLLSKAGDTFKIYSDTGIAAGVAVGWNTDLTITSASLFNVGFNLQVSGNSIMDSGGNIIFTFSGAGVLNVITTIAGKITCTHATAGMLDLNPANTGTQNVIDITPSATLVAGSTWNGMYISGAALDPLTGAACTINGIKIDMSGVDSADGDSVTSCYYASPASDYIAYGYYSDINELQANDYINCFAAIGGVLTLSATATYRGFYCDFSSLARDANAPILQGVSIALPAAYTSFGQCYAGYFTGGGATVEICDGTNAIDATGIIQSSTYVYANGGRYYTTASRFDCYVNGAIGLIIDDALVDNTASVGSSTSISYHQGYYLHHTLGSLMAYKENIIDADVKELERQFDSLRVRSFIWKHENDKKRETTIGFLAEESPDLMQSWDDDGILCGINPDVTIALLVNKVQQLEKRLKALES